MFNESLSTVFKDASPSEGFIMLKVISDTGKPHTMVYYTLATKTSSEWKFLTWCNTNVYISMAKRCRGIFSRVDLESFFHQSVLYGWKILALEMPLKYSNRFVVSAAKWFFHFLKDSLYSKPGLLRLKMIWLAGIERWLYNTGSNAHDMPVWDLSHWERWPTNTVTRINQFHFFFFL